MQFRNRGVLFKSVVIWSVIFTFIFSQNQFILAFNSPGSSLNLISQQKIGEGTHLRKYQKINGTGTSIIHVTHIDLNNPYVKIAPIYGQEGKIAKQPLTKIADEHGAVAAINGSFFNLTQHPAPFAMTIRDGELISSQSKLNDWQVFGITPDNFGVIDIFGFQGEIIASDGARFTIFNLNKGVHNVHDQQGTSSHDNRLNLYNSHWGTHSMGTLPGKTGVVEVVINNGMVTDIRKDQPGVPIPGNGYVLMGHGTAAEYLLNHLRIGDYPQISYNYTTNSTLLEQAIGAHALLVDRGVPVPIPSHLQITGSRARSGVGISHDGKEVFLVAVEASKDSKGMTMSEFAQVFVDLGVWKAANLDGGGSTTMVARMPADWNVSRINTPEGGSLRSIPDGIGVFNTAPPGRLAGIFINGPTNILVGSKASYTLRGYDEHILPYDIYEKGDSIDWHTSRNQVGQFDGDEFVATGSGLVDVIATVQGISNALTIQVFGGSDIAKVDVSPAIISLPQNTNSSFTVNVTTKSGQTFKVLPENVTWQVEGVEGEIQDFTYHAKGSTSVGQLKGNIDGYAFTIPVYQGVTARPFHNLEGLKSYSYTNHPGHLQGSFVPVHRDSGEPVLRGDTSMKLTYNFTRPTEAALLDPQNNVEIAYGRMDDSSLKLPDKTLGIGAWVYGDSSNYWLRAEVKDQSGKLHYITLADKIDWTGWKYVEGHLTTQPTSPITLSSLYVVNLPDMGNLNRPLSGHLYFDQITALQSYDPSYVFGAQRIEPKVEDKGTDLNVQLPALNVKMAAQELGKWVKSYTFTPVDLTKVTQPMPGYEPFAYGFRLEMESLNQGTPLQSLPIEIKTDQNIGIGLLKWNQETQQWVVIEGSPTESGAYRYLIDGDGLYIPFKSTEITPFHDIEGYWAEKSIARMYHKGIIQGMSATEFRPNNPLTRGQFVTLINRVLEKQQPTLAQQLQLGEAPNFKDVLPDWALTGVKAAVQLGVIEGYTDQTFRADLNLNREQLGVIIERLVVRLNIEIPTMEQRPVFTDEAAIPDWARGGAELMAHLNLLPIKDQQFAPKQVVSRGEAAYAIAQLYDWIGK